VAVLAYLAKEQMVQPLVEHSAAVIGVTMQAQAEAEAVVVVSYMTVEFMVVEVLVQTIQMVAVVQ
jgi:hypothetical protein